MIKGKPKSKYHYLKKEYSKQLNPFDKYLKALNYHKDTIRQHKNYTAYYLNWLKQIGIPDTQASYTDMLCFVDYCKDQGDSNNLANSKLTAIRSYYQHLQATINHKTNPASGLFLKGRVKKILSNLLDKKELDFLYQNFQAKDLRAKRNKLILSLLINQAVTTRELHMLEPEHINIKTARITIPRGSNSNSRILELKAEQIMPLQEYLSEIRLKMLKNIKASGNISGRKAQNPDFRKLEKQLFISQNGSTNIKRSLLHFTKNLRQINPNVENLRQIRQSVITLWLKDEDLRIVQYKAGHRYVGTTERYQTNNMEELKEALLKHHPLQ